MEVTSMRSGDALLVIDVQNDFCPGGALPIEAGDRVVPVLNRWLCAARERGIPVYASRDWHPRGHPSFVEAGGEWPAHCVQDTEGAAFHADLELPADVVLVAKGVRFDIDQYSAFNETGLEERLRHDGVRRLWVEGSRWMSAYAPRFSTRSELAWKCACWWTPRDPSRRRQVAARSTRWRRPAPSSRSKGERGRRPGE